MIRDSMIDASVPASAAMRPIDRALAEGFRTSRPVPPATHSVLAQREYLARDTQWFTDVHRTCTSLIYVAAATNDFDPVGWLLYVGARS